MSDENDLPGVVFHKKSSELIGTTTKGVKRVRVVLEAEVRDDAIWAAAEAKLDGLKVFTVDDFKGEMLNALREDYAKIEAERDALLAELQALREDNLQKTAALSVLHRQIDG
jgi:hypothetical protein